MGDREGGSESGASKADVFGEDRGGGGSLRVRILYDRGSVGPGKIRLLELIRETGSISAAARGLDMTFRRGWQLVDTMNQVFREPVVLGVAGGRSGGGASLTPFGEELVTRFRAMEAAAREAAETHMLRLDEMIRPGGDGDDESGNGGPATG